MDKFLVLFFLLTVPALIGIFRSLLQGIYLWQIKEYRVDRVMSFLRYEKKFGNMGTLIWIFKLSLLLLGVIYIFIPQASYLSFTLILAYVVYFLHLEWFLMDLINKRLVRPRIKSPRNLIIGSVVLAIIGLLYGRIVWWFIQFDFTGLDFNSPTGLGFENIIKSFEPVMIGDVTVIPLLSLVAGIALLSALIIDLTLPFWVFLMVLVTSPLAKITRLQRINAAKKIISSRGDNLKIVAITGSYGKTTTKELIYEILKNKFKVAKTPENNNTSVGLSNAIITNVKPDTEIFVVEMGAYKKGEIKESTSIAPPDIAVVTALTQQHLSLFGSKENLLNAKYELIEGMKDDGFAILNGNDEGCIDFANRTNKKKLFFYHIVNTGVQNIADPANTTNALNVNGNIYINKIEDIGEELEVMITYKNLTKGFKVKLKDIRIGLNLVASMHVALTLGMSLDEVVRAVESMNSVSDYLQEVDGINNSKMILDTRSTNLSGFNLAISFLSKKALNKKWVMTQGIIELGSERVNAYEELSESIINYSDGLITTDIDLINSVLSKKSDFRIVKVKDAYDFINAYKFNVAKDDTVLLEGAFPDSIIKELKVNGI
jgi:UDP-N-acetylmuramoyl-tripeptide--D-alanyl-D-alanine ligase